MPTYPAKPASRLSHFPVAFFSIIMGVGGLSLAWFKAHQVSGMPDVIGEALRWLATCVYVLLASLYVSKLIRYPKAVSEELAHPVRRSFFPTISIGLMVLATSWAEACPGAASVAWYLGAGLQLAFTLYTLNCWIHQSRYLITHLSPAWFIPVVGNIFAPIAGVHFAGADLAWFFLSIGLLFWLALFTIVIYRLIFHEALPPAQMPTLFILIAPPALGFLSYTALSGCLDAFARILYFAALFTLLLLASNAPRFLRLPFFLSTWAYSFPLAAMTVATFRMAELSGVAFYLYLGLALLGIASILIFTLLFATFAAIHSGRICVPENS